MKLYLFLITALFFCACKENCSDRISAPCPPESLNNEIIKFDTSIGNFKTNDIDTFYLYLDSTHLASLKPDDTLFLKGHNSIMQNTLKYNRYLTDKYFKQIFKINYPIFKLKKDIQGCGSCDDFEFVSININDSNYTMSSLPLLVKKK
jgi:hypothetical protein